MSNSKIVARNLAYSSITNILGTLVSIYIVIAITRYLGDVNFGMYSVAISLAMLFAAFSDVSLTKVAIVSIARAKEKASMLVSNIFALKVIITTIAYTILLVVGYILYDLNFVTILVFLGIYIFSNAFRQVFIGVFHAHEKFNYETLIVISEKILMIGAIFLMQFFNLSLLSFSKVLMVVSLVLTLFAYLVVTKKLKVKIAIEQISRDNIKKMVTIAVPFAIMRVSSYVFMKIGSVMLSKMVSMQAAGWYNAADQLVVQLFIVSTMVTSTLLPTMTRLATDAKKLLLFTYELGTKYMFVISLPLAIGVSLLSERVISIIYPVQFTPSIIVLSILIWIIPFYFQACNCANVFLASDNVKAAAKIYGLTAIACVVSHYFFIRYMGFIGLAYSMVAVVVFLTTLMVGWLYLNGYKVIGIKHFIKTILSSLIMYLCIKALFHMNLFVIIPIAIVIYFGVLVFVFRIFSKEELAILKSAIKGLRK